MFGPCPVVRIKHDNEEGFVEINESDFDQDRHELCDEQPAGEAASSVKDPKSEKSKPVRKAKVTGADDDHA
jgi:hypothetical protein